MIAKRKSLFNEYETLNEDALLFDKALVDTIHPFIKKWVDAGYSTRDIEHYMISMIGILCSEERLRIQVERRRSRINK